MSAEQPTISTSHLPSQPAAYSAATQAWVRTTRLLAQNEGEAYSSADYIHRDGNTRDLDIGGWVHGEWDPDWLLGNQAYLSQDRFAESLHISPYAFSIPDVRMRERDEVSTDESSMHTRTMRTATGINDGDEPEDDRSTVRAFFEDTVDMLDVTMDERSDHGSLFSASSSGSTPRPNTPQLPIPVRKWTHDPNYDYGIDFSDDEHDEVGSPSAALQRCLNAMKARKKPKHDLGYDLSDDEEGAVDEENVEQLVLSGVNEEEKEEEEEEGEITDLPQADPIDETPVSPTQVNITRGWIARRGGMSINPNWRGSSSSC